MTRTVQFLHKVRFVSFVASLLLILLAVAGSVFKVHFEDSARIIHMAAIIGVVLFAGSNIMELLLRMYHIESVRAKRRQRLAERAGHAPN